MTAPQLRSILSCTAKYRLNDSAAKLLALLGEHSEITMGAAAHAMGISTASLTGIADRLEHLGFASRLYSKRDRRQVYLEITPRGKKALQDILAAASLKERGTGVPPVLSVSQAVPV